MSRWNFGAAALFGLALALAAPAIATDAASASEAQPAAARRYHLAVTGMT